MKRYGGGEWLEEDQVLSMVILDVLAAIAVLSVVAKNWVRWPS